MPAKVAFITGASRSYGRSSVLHLAADGVGIVKACRNSKREADAPVEELTAQGGTAASL